MIKIQLTEYDIDEPIVSADCRNIIVNCLKKVGWSYNPVVSTVYSQPIGSDQINLVLHTDRDNVKIVVIVPNPEQVTIKLNPDNQENSDN